MEHTILSVLVVLLLLGQVTWTSTPSPSLDTLQDLPESSTPAAEGTTGIVGIVADGGQAEEDGILLQGSGLRSKEGDPQSLHSWISSTQLPVPTTVAKSRNQVKGQDELYEQHIAKASTHVKDTSDLLNKEPYNGDVFRDLNNTLRQGTAVYDEDSREITTESDHTTYKSVNEINSNKTEDTNSPHQNTQYNHQFIQKQQLDSLISSDNNNQSLENVTDDLELHKGQSNNLSISSNTSSTLNGTFSSSFLSSFLESLFENTTAALNYSQALEGDRNSNNNSIIPANTVQDDSLSEDSNDIYYDDDDYYEDYSEEKVDNVIDSIPKSKHSYEDYNTYYGDEYYYNRDTSIDLFPTKQDEYESYYDDNDSEEADDDYNEKTSEETDAVEDSSNNKETQISVNSNADQERIGNTLNDDNWSMNKGVAPKQDDIFYGPHGYEAQLSPLDEMKLRKGEPVEIHPHFIGENSHDSSLGILVFYTWIGVVTVMVIGAFIALKHRHRVSAIANYVWDSRTGYRKETVFATEEGRNLLTHQQV